MPHRLQLAIQQALRSFTSIDDVLLHIHVCVWEEAKVLIGCAFFCHLLKPCSAQSRSLQSVDMNNVIDSIEV